MEKKVVYKRDAIYYLMWVLVIILLTLLGFAVYGKNGFLGKVQHSDEVLMETEYINAKSDLYSAWDYILANSGNASKAILVNNLKSVLKSVDSNVVVKANDNKIFVIYKGYDFVLNFNNIPDEVSNLVYENFKDYKYYKGDLEGLFKDGTFYCA